MLIEGINYIYALIAILVVMLAVVCFLYRRSLSRSRAALRLAKRETEEIVQLALNNPYPLIQLSAGGQILFANPIAMSRFPEIREDGLEHDILDGVLSLSQERSVVTREVVVDDIVYAQTIARSGHGENMTVIVYCYDISDRKAYESMLQKSRELADQARQEAERANSARGEFLANMSHELRTPMNGIIGLSAMLAEANLANEEHELADAVNASARNLLIILNDVLDFSKIEAGELQIEAIDFDLVKTVQLIAKLQKPMAESKGLEFICEFDRDIPKYVVGDPARLQQVLNNLVSNALKFTHEGSVKIRVSGERDHDDIYYARIEVRDTGIGIPRDKQPKIFGKFQQGDSSTARKYGGTGLGLAITRNLVALMDGRIKLSSREGEGTIFSIHLPLQVSQKQAEADDSEPYEQIVGLDLSARILIVDDHPVNLLFMRKMMRDLGFSKFKTASSGHEALDLYDLDKPDLILLDCQMPEMDGFEVARRIREKQDSGAAPVIVAVTADAMKGAATKCREAGMDDYISKPVEKDKLVNILGEWLPGDFVPTQTAQHKTSQAEIIDWQHLDEFTEGDKETENHVLGIFIESLSEDMDRLERSLAAGDFHEWNAVVHKMYGACSHFGAGMMAQLCDKAQSLSQTDADNINAAHQLIQSEYVRIHDYLERRIAA